MGYYQGRLIDHIHLRVADLERSRNFYKAALGALNLLDTYGEGEGYFYADELYVDLADSMVSHVHLAFQAQSIAGVNAFYEAALQHGGVDNGPPGPRQYHSTYYGAFVLDPDGNNIEAVWHGATSRSAESVFVERVSAGRADG